MLTTIFFVTGGFPKEKVHGMILCDYKLTKLNYFENISQGVSIIVSKI